MNDRIKELAEQARTYYPKTETSGEYWVFDEQKFAILIIRECATVAIQTQTKNDINNVISKNPAKDFSNALIKHFGVK